MASKGPEAFRTISEVAEELDLPQHVLRFWETKFTQIRPMKRGGGRRYYRPEDIDLLRGIRTLLYGEGYTIRGVQRLLKEQGARYVVSVGRGEAADSEAGAVAGDDVAAPYPTLRESPVAPSRVTSRRGETYPDLDVADEADDDLSFAPRVEREEPSAVDPADLVDDEPSVEPIVNPREFRSEPALRPPAGPVVASIAAAPDHRPAAAGLSKRDVRLLHETLASLLEMKRKLDQARG